MPLPLPAEAGQPPGATGSTGGGLDSRSDEVFSLKPGAEVEGEDDIDAEVLHVLRGMVHSVAMRHFVESERHLFDELEAQQQRAWAQDESRHAQRNQRAQNAQRRATRHRLQHACGTQNVECDSASAGNSSSSSSAGASRGRRSCASGSGPTGSQASALQRRVHDLNVGNLSLTAGSHTASKGSSSGGSGGRAAAGDRLSCGSGGGGAAGRRSVKAPTPVQGQPTALPFATHAESLLPSTPPPGVRSQFNFYVENPLLMHAHHEDQRLIQRRLSMLAALQAETVKMERNQRNLAKANSIFGKLSEPKPVVQHQHEWR